LRKYKKLVDRIGIKPECIQKNRYIYDIIPYNETRVIIKNDNDLNCKGYINANYLNSINGIKLDDNNFEGVVIATQGPLNSTTTQFLKMLIENNIKRIIMVTNIV
jgi:protein tyrosine phosphatase